MNEKMVEVKDILKALDVITGGRLPKTADELIPGRHPFVVEKSSNLPGKSIVETPGLVCGDLDKVIKTVGIGMTLTESMIELAGATGVDAIITHHPVADAASSGGVPLKGYLDLYNLTLFELHEAFHGLHPGIAFLHGHKVLKVDIKFGGIPGNIVFFGKVLSDIHTAGDIIKRLNDFMGLVVEERMLEEEKKIRCCDQVHETTVAVVPKILNGSADSPVENILHIFPHTGFSTKHLDMALEEKPNIDTIISSISRVLPDSPLLSKAKEKNLTFILGNSHAMEIFENGLPLAYALKRLLAQIEIIIFKERMTFTPLDKFGVDSIRGYAQKMANHLLKEK
jgi:hypothetical protein